MVEPTIAELQKMNYLLDEALDKFKDWNDRPITLEGFNIEQLNQEILVKICRLYAHKWRESEEGDCCDSCRTV